MALNLGSVNWESLIWFRMLWIVRLPSQIAVFNQSFKFFGWKLFLFRSYVNVNFFHSKGFSEFEKFALHRSFDSWLPVYRISYIILLYNSLFYIALSDGFESSFRWLKLVLIWFWMLWIARLPNQIAVVQGDVWILRMETDSFQSFG